MFTDASEKGYGGDRYSFEWRNLLRKFQPKWKA